MEKNKKKHLLAIDTDLDLPYPVRHALNADTNPDQAKMVRIRPDPAASGSTTLYVSTFYCIASFM
jgi:hypothetical protein